MKTNDLNWRTFESGSIEQDADIVMFIYRDEYYLEKSEPKQRADESGEKLAQRLQNWSERLADKKNKAEVIVAKQRHGPVGMLTMMFDGQYTRFGDLDERHVDDRHSGPRIETPITKAMAGAVLYIDLDAVRSNYRTLVDQLGGVPSAAVVKADGYGLGAERVGPVLVAAGCQVFFVAHLAEGIALRATLPNTEIHILNGLLPDALDATANTNWFPF